MIPMVRNSERSDFKECQWKWYHSWVLGLTGQRVPTWAWFGTAWHKAMEVRYPVGIKRGHPADVVDAFLESVERQTRKMYIEGASPDEEEIVDGIELGKAMLGGYLRKWGRDQAWEVIHSEQPFQIDVPDPRSPDERIIAVMLGTWDLVI